MRRFSIYIKAFCLICFLFLSGHTFGQDLGSSNKLFGVTKKGASSKTAKKTTARHRSAKPRAHVAAKTTRSVHRSTNPSNAAAAQKKNTGRKTNGADPPDNKKAAGLSGKAADDLYEKLIGEGNDARDERNYAAAETAYQRARAIKPKESRAIYGLGNLYSDQQRWDDAESAYRTALQIEPNNAVSYIALSYVLTQPISAPNLSDRYQEAEKLARRSIEMAPANALAFDQLGVSLELRGLISAETENAYRRSIRLAPTFAPAYAHLGRLLRRRGMMKESAEAYKKAIGLSNDVATMMLVADVMQSEQRFSESEELLRKVLAADPKNPAALLMLGRALTTSGKYAEAETTLRKCFETNPNVFMPNSLLGSLFVRQRRFDMAENALLQALRFVSPNERPMLSRQFEEVGDGYAKTGKSVKAERAYRQAMTLDPENTSVATKIPKTSRG